MTFRGAVVTVGGAAAPIIQNLRQAQPAFVLFVVSERSKTLVTEEILPALDYVPQYNCVLTHDVGDLADCYEKVREKIPGWLQERGLQSHEVYVDITGGTKPMSAALGMAGAEWFNQFSYVSGRERDRDGLGVVVSGTEQVLRTVNPWDKLAVREREKASWLFNDGHADQAAELLRHAAQKCSEALRTRLDTLASLVELFASADKFHFGGLYHRYRRIRQVLDVALPSQRALFHQIEAVAQHWHALAKESESKGKTVSSTLRELLANAERRARQGRYDDAVARLYRAAELFVQHELFEAFAAPLGRLDLNHVPAEARDAFRNEFGQPPYDLGLRKGFRALTYSAFPVHHQAASGYEAIAPHLQKRNDSILAHGLRPADRTDFEDFWGALLPIVQVHDGELPRWPRLEF